MKVGIFFSVTFAIALIGYSIWYRSNLPIQVKSGVIVTNTVPQFDATELQTYTDLTASSSTAQEPATSATGVVLNNSQIIGRSLIADYVNLVSSGQATDENINAIADKYVNSIPTLNKPPVLTSVDIKIVHDTKANLQAYGDQMISAHKSFSQSINKIAKTPYSFTETSSDVYTVMSGFNKEYSSLEARLKTIAVPQSVALDHLALLNSYLSSISATAAITPTQTDSALYFSGLLIFKQNIDTQELLLNKISNTLTAHGI